MLFTAEIVFYYGFVQEICNTILYLALPKIYLGFVSKKNKMEIVIYFLFYIKLNKNILKLNFLKLMIVLSLRLLSCSLRLFRLFMSTIHRLFLYDYQPITFRSFISSRLFFRQLFFFFIYPRYRLFFILFHFFFSHSSFLSFSSSFLTIFLFAFIPSSFSNIN